jgi:hypothetical protein
MVIEKKLLVAINGYYIYGYWWILMVFLLVTINSYFIGGY